MRSRLRVLTHESGSLQQSSNVRPNPLFTADEQIVLYQAGRLNAAQTNEVITKIIEILQR